MKKAIAAYFVGGLIYTAIILVQHPLVGIAFVPFTMTAWPAFLIADFSGRSP
jgi:hypothetical protein